MGLNDRETRKKKREMGTNLDSGLAVLRVEVGKRARDERLLPLEHALLELALLQQHSLGEVVGRAQRREVAEGVLLLLRLGVALLGFLGGVLVRALGLQRHVLGLALLLVGRVKLLEQLGETHHHVQVHLKLTSLAVKGESRWVLKKEKRKKRLRLKKK